MKLVYLFSLAILTGCEKLEFSPMDVFFRDSLNYGLDSVGYVMSNDVLERAYQMATIEWTPRNPVPMNGGRFYSPGLTVRGIPYSSVKEINTYLFQDVSYHTFMTAVHNPKSVFYTENISAAPYHGSNCAPYYGAVCSSAVMYALGIGIPYYTSQIIKLPTMEKLEHQVIDSLRVCDLIWKPGHVQMIFSIEHRADTLFKITTFESSERSAHLAEYSKDQFLKMWNKGKYVGYRYKNIKYSEDVAVLKGFGSVLYNDDLCPSKGDRSVYRTTDPVTINIFNPNYDRIVLLNGSTKEEISLDLSGDEHTFKDLSPGIYSVFLQKGEDRSAGVSFEVIETDVSYSDGDTTDCIVVYFQSSADPFYATLCDLEGNSLRYFPISASDKGHGYIVIPRINRSEYYCKIVFKGKYGRIINEPIIVQ